LKRSLNFSAVTKTARGLQYGSIHECLKFTQCPFLAVKQLEKGGGPGILEQLMPATRMLNRAFEEQFPQCTAARKSIGLVGDSQGCFEAWLKAIDEGL
jgi:hypothetical protein